jgi:hypothetical protein
MQIRKCLTIAIWLVLIPILGATPPSANLRNVDFDLEMIKTPKKIGDTLEISWSFTINEEPDSIYRAFCRRHDSLLRIHAYFKTFPEQEYLSGDSDWIGNIVYGRTISFSSVYKIISAGKITGGPIVEFQRELNGRWIRSNRNCGKGFMLVIKDTIETDTIPRVYIDVIGDDTIKTIPDAKLPDEFMTLDAKVIKFKADSD